MAYYCDKPVWDFCIFRWIESAANAEFRANIQALNDFDSIKFYVGIKAEVFGKRLADLETLVENPPCCR